MKTYFDNQILPRSRELDKSLGVKYITVQAIEPEKDPFGKELTKVPVMVNYRFKESGNQKWLANNQIESLKMIGVLPR